jgi:hypothetical protein
MRQIRISLYRDSAGRLRRRVRPVPADARMAGSVAPWVWARLQAEQAALHDTRQ